MRRRIRRYPKSVEPYQSFLDWLIQQKNAQEAAAVALRIKAAFPADVQLAVSTDANLARVESGPSAALEVYAKSFSPFWPDALKTEYFQGLANGHQLRAFLANAQSAAVQNPTALDPALRIYFYYDQQNRKDAADQELLSFLTRRAASRAAWRADELKTVGTLFQRVQDYDESARAFYLLYELPAAAADDKEFALASLISLLLDVPEQPLDFGSRDLSLYKNIGTMDRHPGFLNGILSLTLNSTFPDYQYQTASQNAVSYFHRASASRLVEKLKQQFPNSSRTPELEAKLFSAYSVYGQYDAVIQAVPLWLEHNRNADDYVNTALLLADAYAATKDTKDELAIYDRLLTELAGKSGHMPIGDQGVVTTAKPGEARSPDYARVLDRYISRMVQLGRPLAAINLFRNEIDQNPDDPGLYQRLALFVEQNRLDAELEQTYRQAFSRFKDMSWASKLGRFYLREKEYTAYTELTHQITNSFAGSEVADFLEDVKPNPELNPTLYRQINLYAHQRFPHNLVFVNNLLNAYRTKGSEDMAAYERLLRQNWFYDSDLRTKFFQYLTSQGSLGSELASLPSFERAAGENNIAALQFRAQGQAWLTEYEEAAPTFVRLAAFAPGDLETNAKAISIERSLSLSVPGAFDSAIRLAEQDVKAAPGDREIITRVGEIYADRELYAQARPWWNRVATGQPGLADGYLESATVFWDYFQFSDALRIIGEARRALNQPARFGYEAGAIYENEGDYREAVTAYIQAALKDSPEQARARLITLARRPSTSALVERETAALTATGFDWAAFQLRLTILERQDRRGEIETMLSAMLARASNTTEVNDVRSAANRLGFDAIGGQALQRIVALTADPIEKIQARIDLAQFYESHRDPGKAEQEFSSLLNDYPSLLGVVRAVVDFYWREKAPQKAISTLEAAATRAKQPFQNQLRREAAQKATDSGDYAEARLLLGQLLQADAYNGDLLAAEAATYARQNDNAGLVSFYAATLKAMQSASLPALDKTARIAGLRRGYILALITVQQFQEALEQYQQVLNQYPEDVALAAEASRFAESHQLAGKLVAYYDKATQDAPRDYRWPLAMARIEAALRQYPEAIAAYDKAGYVRPDRADIFEAKADLQVRLLRFEDAIKTYQKLYELSYHDVQYLSAQATLNARLGNRAEAIRLLRAGYVDPHPNEPAGYVSVMQQLANWRMFEEVDQVFREIRPVLTSDSAWSSPALTMEAEALASLHRPMDAIAMVAAMVRPAETSTFAQAIGSASQEYLTPEERADFAQQIEKPGGLPPQFGLYWLASAAGLEEAAAQALVKASESRAGNEWQTLNQLQSSRLRYEDLGKSLEAIAKTRPAGAERDQVEQAAFQAYRGAGDTASQLRLGAFAGEEFPRVFINAGGDLNKRLSELASHDPSRANAVAQYAIANGPSSEAVEAIGARGSALSPLWTNSYAALAGLYYLSPAAWATQAFNTVLGPRTVAGEISAKAAEATLQGGNWFYYAGRYGAYLGYRGEADAGDLLLAPIEAAPAASNSYVELGDTYRELKQASRAAQLYMHALELSPARPDVYDRLAILSMQSNQHSQAVADWRRAFELLAAGVEQGPLPPSYWETAQKVLDHMNEHQAVAELKPDADAMLRAYIKRNGEYNFAPFLRGILSHAPDRQAAAAWVAQLAQLPGMERLFEETLNSNWIPEQDKDPLYRAEVTHQRNAVNSAAGLEPEQAAREVLKQQLIQYARYLEAQGRPQDEWAILDEITPATERPQDLLLHAAALTGRLGELLKSYQKAPDATPSGEQVLRVASALDAAGRHDLALQLEEFEYQREIQSDYAPASAWFGLTRVRLEQKRNDEALSLIHDVTLSVGAPFENLPEAVHMLEKAGLKQNALQYATEWQTAEPWNDEAQLAVARIKGDAGLLDSIRRSPHASYPVRVQAARAMREAGSSVPGADELALLTHPSISASQASQPFFVEARLNAANSSGAAEQIQLYREAIAIDPNLRGPRLELAQAAFSQKRNAFGLAVFNSYRYPAYQAESGHDREAVVEEAAAAVLAELSDFGGALALYEALIREVKDPAKLATLEKARATVVRQQKLQIANTARQPVVTAEIAQKAIVKPKLKSPPEDEGGAK